MGITYVLRRLVSVGNTIYCGNFISCHIIEKYLRYLGVLFSDVRGLLGSVYLKIWDMYHNISM